MCVVQELCQNNTIIDHIDIIIIGIKNTNYTIETNSILKILY